MFSEEREESLFEWSMIGDIAEGRPNLGSKTDVAVYRLMQFTLRDVLVAKYDVAAADEVFNLAGESAGRALFKNAINNKGDFSGFIKELQDLLKQLGVGILRVERADLAKMQFTITVAEDLDCSGLPFCDETICTYDEGFISGLMSEFAGGNFSTKEIDCWCSGDRVCRFEVKPV